MGGGERGGEKRGDIWFIGVVVVVVLLVEEVVVIGIVTGDFLVFVRSDLDFPFFSLGSG